MGFWDFITGGQTLAAPVLPVSPWAPSSDIDSILVSQLWPEHDTASTITRDTALRIPGVKRAHDVTCGVLSRMPWRLMNDEVEVADQAAWLVTTQTGIPPRNLRWGVVSDLFMNGWAVIGFETGPDDLPVDALHIPFGWWSIGPDGTVRVAEHAAGSIPARYRDRLVPIALGYGSNGMLNDAVDAMRAARTIEAAYRDRIENPIAQTVLTIARDMWDYWTPDERETFRKKWIASRSAPGGATSLKPDWVTVDYPSSIPADLFESGRNGSRLDLANHAGIPAGLIEASRQGGSGGTEMHYSGVANGASRNELWDYGLAKYADAIEARLSLDDVCAPGLSVRVDTSNFLTVPQPATGPTSED
ncbi:hypothetical protein [Microbacterium sp.]|uniref:hypothetical protein n=1 Tax=Microbacterium sp. TaxID=51671 RepID=UPI003A94E834